MAATPQLTALRGLHHFFAAFDRSHYGATTVTLINNGGRSKLLVSDYDGTIKPLAPTMHASLGRGIDAAALIAARAAYGPRSQWPTRIVFTRPAAPLTAEDAAAHLGDHVFNNRVYTFSPAAADAAHKVMASRQLVRPGVTPYKRACATLARLVGMPDNTRTIDVFFLARSYTRRHPASTAA